ncbi:hypothetical protein [Jiulongibacter sp. NS-SX5]|uniref:hypothetical protein n=1 Tax=Jiulongibacter sp. NS-SX5 TaxID=3463854 RepID=UPI004059A73D
MTNQQLNIFLKKVEWFNRISLFIIYFWFGFLKVLGTSPAEGLVIKLFDQTLAGIIPIEVFLPAFGVFECTLGLLWVFPKFSKTAFMITCIHMFSTFLPMAVLEKDTWQSFMTLTLTGQYIVKNLILIGVSWFIYQMHSFETESQEEKRSFMFKVLVRS